MCASARIWAAVGRARNRRVGERFMAVHELSGALEARHHQSAVAISLVVQARAGGDEPGRTAGGDERSMEPLVQGVERRFPLSEALGIVGDVAFELMQRANDLALPGAVPSRDAEPDRFALEHAANADDVGEIVTRDRLHAETAFADRVDKTARRKTGQCLAQRRRPDAVTGGRLRDA